MSRILIVDDEETIRFSFTAILEESACEVFLASDFTGAKTVLDTTPVDVMIVDRLLRSDDGMRVVEYANAVQNNCTAIMMSAFPTFNSASEGYKNNVFAYLQKPVKKDDLLDTVSSAVLNTRKNYLAKMYKRELIQAQKVNKLDMLYRGIIHDLNNVVMAMNGRLELMAMDLDDDAPVMNQIMKMMKVGQHGSRLCGQFMSYLCDSKTEPVAMGIHAVMEEAIELLAAMMPGQIMISCHLGDENVMALVHPDQIIQVILNIGMNAIQAIGGKKGMIQIRLDVVVPNETEKKILGMPGSSCIRILMDDTGCGMDQTTVERMFDSFFSTKPQGVGVGIGLSTSYQIIRDHGGIMTAESRIGCGSIIYVYLPVYEPPDDK